MYNNKAYYLEQLKRAHKDAEDDLSEGGSDFLHVTLDALGHLEGAIAQGFKPWESYGEPEKCYRVTVKPGVHTDVWAPSLHQAHENFLEDNPKAEIVSIVLQE